VGASAEGWQGKRPELSWIGRLCTFICGLQRERPAKASWILTFNAQLVFGDAEGIPEKSLPSRSLVLVKPSPVGRTRGKRMSKSKHSEAEIIAALKQLEAGRSVVDLARERCFQAHELRMDALGRFSRKLN
jgi:hypothetical protein